MSPIAPLRTLVVLTAALAVTAGCGVVANRGAERQAKRDQDRHVMQVEDLTNQRNALQSELARVKQANTESQKNLASAQQQLEQARIELGRARAELQSAQAARQQAESQKAELDTMRRQLDQLKNQVNRASPAAGAEGRVVTPAAAPPTTQPGNNANK